MAASNEMEIIEIKQEPPSPAEVLGFCDDDVSRSPSNTNMSSEQDDLPPASDFLSVQMQEDPPSPRKDSLPSSPLASKMDANPMLISCLTSGMTAASQAAVVQIPDKTPRKDLTLANRIALLEQIKRQPPNTSHRQLSKITGVPKSTIARVIQQQYKLQAEWALQGGQRRTSQKRKREGKNPDVEEALNKWFSIATAQGVHVNGPMLRTKSEELAKMLGHTNFKATDGWLSRWKSRNGIKFKKAHGEKESADFENVGQWESTKLANVLKKFCADDIYNVGETDLFYRDSQDGSLSNKHTTTSGSKKTMDHVTVLCCSNLSGTDKRKLVIVGKIAKPRCFKGLRMDGLPVLYYANNNASMTSDIFKQWLMSWDSELHRKSRKILLLLEKCAAHPHLDFLSNVQMEFLPADTTSLLQSMELGIIKKLKALYRGRLVNYILEAVEENQVTSPSKAKEVGARITILQALQFVADSWREISSKTIQNCFAQCGFKNSVLEMPGTTCTENEIILELQRFRHYQELLCIDNGVKCYNENSDCEKAVTEQIATKHIETRRDEESDEDNTPERELVTNRDAKKFIAELRRYFMQEGSEGSPLSALDICADFVQLQSRKRMHHGTVNKLLKNTS